MGGKVQALAGFADHVVFLDKRSCASRAQEKTCVAMCSGQAITLIADGNSVFDRGEVCALRRMRMELRAVAGWGAQQHRVQGRSRGLHRGQN